MENENEVIIPDYLLNESSDVLLIQEPYILQDDIDNSSDSSELVLFESTVDYSNDINVLNENIINLHTSVKIGISLIFCIVVYLLLKCAFYIFNRILGLGSC